MEDPESREAEINNRIVKRLNDNRVNNQTRWGEKMRAEKSWQNTWSHHARDQDVACCGEDGKQGKYYATPTSRANSYESILDTYLKKELELAERSQK